MLPNAGFSRQLLFGVLVLGMYNFKYCIIYPREMKQERMISCGCYDPDTNCEKTASLRNHSRVNPLSLKSYISQVT